VSTAPWPVRNLAPAVERRARPRGNSSTRTSVNARVALSETQGRPVSRFPKRRAAARRAEGLRLQSTFRNAGLGLRASRGKDCVYRVPFEARAWVCARRAERTVLTEYLSKRGPGSLGASCKKDCVYRVPLETRTWVCARRAERTVFTEYLSKRGCGSLRAWRKKDCVYRVPLETRTRVSGRIVQKGLCLQSTFRNADPGLCARGAKRTVFTECFSKRGPGPLRAWRKKDCVHRVLFETRTRVSGRIVQKGLCLQSAFRNADPGVWARRAKRTVFTECFSKRAPGSCRMRERTVFTEYFLLRAVVRSRCTAAALPGVARGLAGAARRSLRLAA